MVQVRPLRLRYTPAALAELEQVLAYLSELSPQGAQRVRTRIRAVLELLSDFPRNGARVGQLRRIRATPYPYLIFYEIAGNEIVVVAVRHGARDPSKMPNPS
ncbi:type II toxin-antitoxin system RelE/ParE family toxin [Methylopila turkensis]|uniref:Plasmid stabilization protein ParE n=1 Tax=Methylopila turkensis TaxID=1437816 RepID=A0A9W6JSV5_9HYPH|nr:type II toxin-antitoxin system RelE/ParE family toxin [Methylopila turkensis]GLK80978.1 plasmid stabilization protein ParE [Methylopila turkensis]